MSDTDELRERLWDWADQILDLWNIEDTNPPSLTEGFADLLLPVVAAVVAEARTEGAIAELEAAANSKHSVTTVVTASTVAPPEYAVSERFDFNQSERARLLARAVALRGVGNQKAEPTKRRLRSGFPDYWCHICDAGAEGCEHPLPADQKGTEQ